MKKLVIFNVGGALSAYAEIDDKKIMIDLGAGSNFSPVDNFLIPLAKIRNFKKTDNKRNIGKYEINQLFLSHLDNDHISDFTKFMDIFYPIFLTCPNDNNKPDFNGQKQSELFKINTDLYGEENDVKKLVLTHMREERSPRMANTPLVSISENISLFFIKPKECELVEELRVNYANNISLILFIELNGKSILFPGDILPDGMSYLIQNNPDFKSKLNNIGVDFLIAPHHGLSTSFSERLFQELAGNRTRLNIISEKVRRQDSEENRSIVDSRYYITEYSSGQNSLEKNAVKTSLGHIVIDLESGDGEIKQLQDISEVLKEFI